MREVLGETSRERADSLEKRLREAIAELEELRFETNEYIKGTGHFFETLSVGSVPGADHS